eukprot:TRINITY_DN1761_c1_g1_i8.p1 TRINITY_DN1761_c1_g1~~TRINITY_DN1761_c1_g1_i8.p1  ORF type:complete len:844 (-),score=213.05 TRINITY_DN1761_c1_g1_i8:18-2549(-)
MSRMGVGNNRVKFRNYEPLNKDILEWNEEFLTFEVYTVIKNIAKIKREAAASHHHVAPDLVDALINKEIDTVVKPISSNTTTVSGSGTTLLMSPRGLPVGAGAGAGGIGGGDDSSSSTSTPSSSSSASPASTPVSTFAGGVMNSPRPIGSDISLSPLATMSNSSSSNGKHLPIGLNAYHDDHGVLFYIDLFNSDFLSKLVQEVDHMAAVSSEQVLNSEGIPLEHFGFDHFMGCLTQNVIQPLVQRIFPFRAVAYQGARVVRFAINENENSQFEIPHCDMSLNISLGKYNFGGGELLLPRESGGYFKFPHTAGCAVMDFGGRGKIPASQPITRGQKYSLMIWYKSHSSQHNLMSLPPSVLGHVLSFLPLPSMSVIERSCKAFNAEALDMIVWRPLFMRTFAKTMFGGYLIDNASLPQWKQKAKIANGFGKQATATPTSSSPAATPAPASASTMTSSPFQPTPSGTIHHVQNVLQPPSNIPPIKAIVPHATNGSSLMMPSSSSSTLLQSSLFANSTSLSLPATTSTPAPPSSCMPSSSSTAPPSHSSSPNLTSNPAAAVINSVPQTPHASLAAILHHPLFATPTPTSSSAAAAIPPHQALPPIPMAPSTPRQPPTTPGGALSSAANALAGNNSGARVSSQSQSTLVPVSLPSPHTPAGQAPMQPTFFQHHLLAQHPSGGIITGPRIVPLPQVLRPPPSVPTAAPGPVLQHTNPLVMQLQQLTSFLGGSIDSTAAPAPSAISSSSSSSFSFTSPFQTPMSSQNNNNNNNNNLPLPGGRGPPYALSSLASAASETLTSSPSTASPSTTTTTAKKRRGKAAATAAKTADTPADGEAPKKKKRTPKPKT